MHRRFVEAGLVVVLAFATPSDLAWDVCPSIMANGITCRRIAYVDDWVAPMVGAATDLVVNVEKAAVITRDTYLGNGRVLNF